MVYESDFYTTRRYRTSPSLSTYTVSYQPSRQVRLLPGLGKVHVVHTYDRIVPYVGHKRLTVVSPPPQIFSVRPSVLLREFDRIQYKYRPAVSYSYVNNYLNSNSAVRMYYIRNPITTSRYTYTPTSAYYHSIIGRPLRLYSDILGYPRWSRYWYRYWDDIPSSRYSNYYWNDISTYRYSPYSPRWYSPYTTSTSWHSYLSPYWYKYSYPSLSSWYPAIRTSYDYTSSPSWYKLLSTSSYRYWYPSLTSSSYSSLYPSWYKYPSLTYPSSYSSISPYWSKYWTSYDSPYYWSTYWQPSWSRYWRSNWNSSWNRWYDYIFNDETSRIRADAAGLLKRIHTPVVRTPLSMLPYSTRYSEPFISSRITSDDYIYKMLNTSPYNSKTQYTTYYSEPIRKYIGPGHLAAVSYAGGKAYGRRPNIYSYEDPVKDDIQLLSYYINKFRSDKAAREGAPDEKVEDKKIVEISAA